MAYSPSVKNFSSACNALTDFTSNTQGTGDTLAVATGGYLHNCLTYTLGTTNNQTNIEENISSSDTVQLWIKVDGAATLSTSVDHNFLHTSEGATPTGWLDVHLIGVTGGYTLRIVDAENSYTTIVGTTVLSLGQWYKVCLTVSGGTVANLYIGNNDTAEVSYTLPAAEQNKTFTRIDVGKWYSTCLSGKFYVDEISCWTASSGTPTTVAQENLDCYNGWIQRYQCWDGAIVRPGGKNGSAGSSEGSGTTNGDDIVSEGVAYTLVHAVENNDQTTFNLEENWIEANLVRSLNGALTTGLTLMPWHFDNEAFSVLDWNIASDADNERCWALLQAHGRWGSGGAINYLSKAKAIAADLKAYTFNSYNGKQYQCGDLTGLGVSPFEQATSYFNFPLYRLLYQYTSDQFWLQVIEGYYDVLNQTTQTTGNFATPDGLDPDWNMFNSSTGLAVIDTNSGRGTDYGWNAFRTPLRTYLDNYFYDEPRAITYLSGNKYTFFNNLWTTNGVIDATYSHSGTVTGAYEKGCFYGTILFAFIAAGNTTSANNIYTNKVFNYRQHAGGSYFADTSSYFQPSYFGNAWTQLCVLVKEKIMQNYGAWKYTSSQAFLLSQ